MRPLHELHLSNVQPPPTADEIDLLQKRIGFPISTVFIALLQEVNGGHPEVDTFETKDEQWAVNNFFFIGANQKSTETESIIWNFEKMSKNLPRGFLPFARDGFGNCFLLDAKAGNVDEGVWVWVHDAPNHGLVKLSNSLEDFIDQLKPNPDYI